MSDPTAQVPVPAQQVAPGSLMIPDAPPEGLEDFGAGDAITPTLSLDHDNALFVDSLTNDKFPELNCIVLGLIKTRVMWPPELPDGGGKSEPLCKSNNFAIGLPGKGFPWNGQGVFPIPAFNTDGTYVEQPQLACAQCPFKEWETHPTRANVPWCSEQYVLALLVPNQQGTAWAPSLLTLHRSALANTRAYMTAFRNAGSPMFTVFTKITLQANKRGNVDYAVPVFLRGPATPEGNWPFFSGEYKSLREFVQNRGLGAGSDEGTDNDEAAEAALAAQAAPVAHPQAAAAPVAESVAQPVQQPVAQPVQQPVAQPVQQPVAPQPVQAPPPVAPEPVAAPAPVQPVQQPVPEAAPAAPVAPQAADPNVPPAVAQAFPGTEQVAAPPAAQAPGTPVGFPVDDDDVPF